MIKSSYNHTTYSWNWRLDQETILWACAVVTMLRGCQREPSWDGASRAARVVIRVSLSPSLVSTVTLSPSKGQLFILSIRISFSSKSISEAISPWTIKPVYSSPMWISSKYRNSCFHTCCSTCEESLLRQNNTVKCRVNEWCIIRILRICVSLKTTKKLPSQSQFRVPVGCIKKYL